MALDRRRFVSGVAAGFAALGLPRGLRAAPPEWTTPDGGVDWRAVRDLFDLDPRLIHLGCFYITSHPRPVREAVARYRRWLDENPLWLEQALFEETGEHTIDRVKGALAEYTGGKPDEIALTGNTTTGLALLYNGLTLHAGDEILTTEHDHYVHHTSIAFASRASGATVRKIALHDGAFHAGEDEMTARLAKAIGPKTRVVGVTWVHSSTGLKTPIRRFAQAVAEANRNRAAAERVLLVVDGVHGFALEDEDVAKLGADFFVAGTHKWLFGPRGTGFVWGAPAAWPRVRPVIPSFESLEMFEAWTNDRPLGPMQASFLSPGGFHAYEHVFGVEAAVRFHQKLGRARVSKRIHELNHRFRDQLGKMPKITLHTPLDDRLAGGIVCFEVAGMKPAEVVARLGERRILATTSPYRVSYARVAAGIMVTPEEVETTLAAIRDIAKGSTPGGA